MPYHNTYIKSCIQPSTFKLGDITTTVFHEVIDQVIVSKHDSSHLSEETVATLVGYVVHHLDQARNSLALTFRQKVALRILVENSK